MTIKSIDGSEAARRNTVEHHKTEEDARSEAPLWTEIEEKTNRRLVRKIDWKIMPVLCMTYSLQFYDKVILGQAAIFGLMKDLSLQTGLKYSWATLIFYFGYMLGTYPLSFLAQKYTPRVVCTAICVLWSIVVLSTAGCKSYTGLLVNRFVLGLLESGVSPIFMLVVGMWYTHPEQVLRSSYWYSFSGGTLLWSPLINYGLGHLVGGLLHPWQYMYLVAGAITFLWGVALWWVFPDTPHEAKGFTDEERKLLLERVRANSQGAEYKRFKTYQLREALIDYQFWGILILSTVSSIGSGVLAPFGSIIFNGMGFSTFTSLLLNLPIGAMAFICIIGSGYLGRALSNARLYLVAASCLPVILGCGLLWQLPPSNRGGRIAGFYLISFFSSAWVQCIGLGTSNVAGHTKTAAYAAGTFVGFSLGNIIGPLMFDAKYAPHYDQSFSGLLVCFSICFVAALSLRFFLARENAAREATYGPPETANGSQDLTDRENTSFRYNL